MPGSPVAALYAFHKQLWRTPFGRFYFRLQQSTRDALEETARTETSHGSTSEPKYPLFPCPLPFPEAFEPQPVAGGRGRLENRRRQKRWGARALANLAIGFCNFCALGSPAGQHRVVFPGGGALTREQQVVSQEFLKEAEEWCAASGGEITTTGRGTARLFQMIQTLEHKYGHGPRTERDCRTVTVAETVQMDKVSMPQQAGQLQASTLMCPERAAVFKDLNSILLPFERIPAVSTRACHMIDADDEIRFVKRLLGTKMAVLLPESEVARHPVTGRLLRGGFFCVPHREGRQRLIFDRRPLNELEEDLSSSWLALPHGSQFTEMQLARSQGVRGCTDDLSNWFYQLAHEAGWWRRQAVGRRLCGSDFREFGGVEGMHYRCALTVIAMGDRNGVAFAQETHEHILRSAGLLQLPKTLRFGKSVPQTALWEGAYVDDHVFSLQLPVERLKCQPGCNCRHCGADEGLLEDVVAVGKLEAGYETFDAAQAVEKRTRFETDFVAWGTSIKGRRGVVAVDSDKRRKVTRLCFSLARRGTATKAVLRSMVGSLIHPFMHRQV